MPADGENFLTFRKPAGFIFSLRLLLGMDETNPYHTVGIDREPN
jgi:hypothetical protein